MINNSRNPLNFHRNKRQIISHLVTFLLGAIIFGGVGIVVATSISSSNVGYVTSQNNDVLTVEDALDDLYTEIVGHPTTCFNGICGKLSFRYWNDDFNGTQYSSNQIPTTNYATRTLLAQNYSNFANRPYYIRSILIDGNVVGHQACLWNSSTNKEFCFNPSYWAGAIGTQDATIAANMKIKLKRDMQNALGVTIQDSDCSSANTYADCRVGSFYCSTNCLGYSYCFIGNIRCYVTPNYTAYCILE